MKSQSNSAADFDRQFDEGRDVTRTLARQVLPRAE
jgi:hypothetical protein